MINVDDVKEIFSKCYLVLMKNISTCCMEDCPACIAANAPVRPEGLLGGNESRGFDGNIGGHFETLVSPNPLLNKAFNPLLLIASFPGKNGRFDIDFEVAVNIDALSAIEDADFSILLEP